MMGSASTRAPGVVGRGTVVGPGVMAGPEVIAGPASRGGPPPAPRPGRRRGRGTPGGPRRAMPGPRRRYRWAAGPVAPGPAGAGAASPGCGRPRRRWSGAPRNRPGRAGRSFRDRGTSRGRRAHLGPPGGRLVPPRRTHRGAAGAARWPTPDPPGASGGELGAALGPARGEDRASGTGAHAQPEAVGLRAPAVVRLEGALAHVSFSVFIGTSSCTLLGRLTRQPFQSTRTARTASKSTTCTLGLRVPRSCGKLGAATYGAGMDNRSTRMWTAVE